MARPRTGSIYWTKNGWSARITINVLTSVGTVVWTPSFPLGTTSKKTAELAAQRLADRYAAGLELANEKGIGAALKEWRAAADDHAAAVAGEAPKAVVAKLKRTLSKAWKGVSEELDQRRAVLLDGAQAEAQRVETCSEAWERIVAQQAKEGLKTWQDRRSRLNRFAAPIARRPVDQVEAPEIEDDVYAPAAKVLAKGTMEHLRDDLHSVFHTLWRHKLISENPMLRAVLPKNMKQDKRPRVLLTDEQFNRFMACREVSEILQLKAISSRMFGGMRTSDLHAWDWEHVDLETWFSSKVYRPKTDGGITETHETELVELVIPERLKRMLHAYWTTQGKPTSGPVFPVLRGKRKGERQGKRSHARELRDGLWIAGIHNPLPGFAEAMEALGKLEAALAEARASKAKGKVRELQRARTAAEEAARERDMLQAGSPKYKCAEFHSFRRAFNTALGAAGVNAQQAMALAGHKDPRTHMRYVLLGQGAPLVTPEAALPHVSTPAVVLASGAAVSESQPSPGVPASGMQKRSG
jgi:integrase